MNPLDPVILALDTSDPVEAREWLALLPDIRRAKVGLQLYLAGGWNFVADLIADGIWVFLDLKLHDIPNTVAQATAEIVRRGVSLTTVHALGGARLIEAACEARDRVGGSTEIVAVTALTSHAPQEWRALGFDEPPDVGALRLARDAVAAGADGVVASPLEAAALRRSLGPAVRIVTPGVRLKGQDGGDQRRIATPAEALAAGATYLVVGRALTAAPDPVAAAAALAAELSAA